MDLRRDLGLDHPYGTVAKAKKLGELRPTPGVRTHKPITRADPSEREEATVIPATLSEPEHAASEYGQALSDARGRTGSTRAETSATASTRTYCLQNSYSSDFGACDAA